MLSEKSKHWLLIASGTLVWSLTMVKSGWIYPYGLGFWGPNGHDGVWHISLIESFSRGDFTMPVFAGSSIQNYHIGFDLLLAGIHLLSRIPASVLYFQIIPPVLAFLVGLLAYRLVNLWSGSTRNAWWATFFVYFGGSWGWLVELLRGHWGGGESLFWAQQSISSLINPPFALSLVVLFAALISLHRRRYLLSVLLLALLPQIKIYAGLLAFAGLFFASFNNRRLWRVIIPAGLLAAVLFLPFNARSAGLLVWRPLWFLDTLFSPDRLNWPRFFSALSTYKMGHIWVKAIGAYSVAFVIFLVGNLGTRLVFAGRYLSHRRLDWQEIFFLSSSVIGLFFPLLFLQQGTAWNTIQFFYYSQVFLGLLAGMFLGFSRFKPVLIGILIVLFTLPTTWGTLQHYLPSRPPAMISSSEITALNFLSQLPSGTVLTPLFSRDAANAAQNNPPRPLYLYESGAYVSAFGRHPVYLEDEVNLDITNYPWRDRRASVAGFYAYPAMEYLHDRQIKYLYLVKSFPLDLSRLTLKLLYSNQEISLYEVL
jgi:hypothetical protein